MCERVSHSRLPWSGSDRCHGQGAISGLGLLKEKQKSELRVSRLYIEVERERERALELGLLKEKQKSELRVSRRYIEVEREIALDLVSRRSV